MDATHSKKPIREKDSSSKYNLAQLHKLQTKKFFNVRSFLVLSFIEYQIFTATFLIRNLKQ